MIVSAILLLGLLKPRKKLRGREDTDVKEKKPVKSPKETTISDTEN